MKRNYEHFIIQGNDFKARYWMEPFGENTHFFRTANELINAIKLKGKKCLIFRYMNSEEKFSTDVKYTGLLIAIGLFKRFLNIDLYWIMHNIDKETVDKRPLLTKIRRGTMKISAKKIFVTDPYFKELHFKHNKRVEAITFGEKRDGSISRDNLEKIKKLKDSYDLVSLCVGAKGEKYTHFKRLAYLTGLANSNGIRLAFILPAHIAYQEANSISINEPNIDESAIAPYVDFVYRINDDISMPYTLYAASCASIPIVTSKDFFTYKIVERYGIGFDEIDYFSATSDSICEVKKNMGLFISRSNWGSLSDRIQH